MPAVPPGPGAPGLPPSTLRPQSPSGPGASWDPAIPRRLHPLSPVLDVFPVAGQALLPLFVLAWNFREVGLGLMVLVTVLFVGYRFLAWSRFSYAVIDGTLRIEHGVLQRHVREVPVTRIQQVDLRRQVRHRVAGVVAVRIDTAGGGAGAEAVLDCLSDAAALALRSELLDPRHRPVPAVGVVGIVGTLGTVTDEPDSRPDPDGTGPAGWAPPPALAAPRRAGSPVGGPAGSTPTGTGWGSPPPGASPGGWPGGPVSWAGGSVQPGGLPGEELVRLSTRDLVVAGITGSGLLAGLSIIGFVFLVLGEVPGATADEVGGRAAALFGTLVIIVVAAIVALPFFLAAAAAASVLRDHEFTLVRYGNDLHVKRGLLDQREATLALHRLQAVWVLDNPLRRRLGLVSVQLQSAGGSQDGTGQAATTTIPLVRRRDLGALLAVVLPSPPVLPGGPEAVATGTLATETLALAADAVTAEPVPAAGPTAGLPVALAAAPAVARRRSLVRFVAPVPAAGLVVGLVAGSVWVGLAATAVLAVPAWAMGTARYRALAHGVTSGTVVARTGALLHRTALVPVARTQSHRVASSPFQRRSGLATLTIQVAGRGRTVALVDLHDHRCRVVGDHALGSTEARRDELAVRRRTLGQLEGSFTAGG